MGSTRLPGKILMKVGAFPLLEHIFFRLKNAKLNFQVIVATSTLCSDDIVENFCNSRGVVCFRGSETDVLERYYLCAKENEFSDIIRMTGDNPFPDVDELRRLVEMHTFGEFDYSHSFDVLPVGVGLEIFTYEALERSYYEGVKANQREHVNEYIQENPQKFKIGRLFVDKKKERPDIRLTIDTEDDYRRACELVVKSKNLFPSTEELIKLCSDYV